jgi:NAD-reducing hydrogenase small subunit
MKKVRLATIWLDGCSGCHMSLLDIDAAVIALAGKVDIVYGPLVDAQEFPEAVDVTLVEGAISSVEDAHRIEIVRHRTNILVALGDCAVTGNVPSMRNSVPVTRLLQRVYVEGAETGQLVPTDGVPALLPKARPVQEFVPVDIHVPGCPPPAKAILALITDLLEGRKPAANPKVKFG